MPAAAAPQPTAVPRSGSEKDIILATTTSTQDSGLLDVLVPMFQQQTGYNVKTISIGTGAALALGARGEADVVLVHAPPAEVQWMAQGNGTERILVMHNDFIIVGPAEDPAKIKGDTDAVGAMKQIADARAPFVSRGDNSWGGCPRVSTIRRCLHACESTASLPPPLSVHYLGGPPARRGLVLGFGGYRERQMADAAKRMAEVIRGFVGATGRR
ncbi:MAG TPA: substrate-binding domain-containing protein [Chloroflexota bacterium]|nr:substrate-binding domain-containing protein [Chloroflexota bacterium]